MEEKGYTFLLNIPCMCYHNHAYQITRIKITPEVTQTYLR